MTTEQKAKKNPDYSASANITNNEVVEDLLNQYINEQVAIQTLNEEMQKLIPTEMKLDMEQKTGNLEQLNIMLHKAIDEAGSYQDIEAGHYAVKQRKVSKSYDASKFGGWYPQFKDAVIVPSVNLKALQGLIKGGLIKEDSPEMQDITQTSESFVYIIK